ncbi:MAG: DinB family protein [Chloroflexi bacterium]|nr:DinB family protein [Chloroflexota bacterium]MDA1271958.1 DinB family protein [Chloroflexota bacterium]
MSAAETALTALERNWAMVDKALEDVDDAMIGVRLNDESNSMGWLLWHMTRVVDRFVHTWCQEVPQLWVKDGWNDKFGLDGGIDNTGQGWTKEQVAAWQLPAKESLVGYYAGVKAAASEYIGALSVTDMERQLNVPPRPPASIGTFFGSFVLR